MALEDAFRDEGIEDTRNSSHLDIDLLSTDPPRCNAVECVHGGGMIVEIPDDQGTDLVVAMRRAVEDVRVGHAVRQGKRGASTTRVW